MEFESNLQNILSNSASWVEPTVMPLSVDSFLYKTLLCNRRIIDHFLKSGALSFLPVLILNKGTTLFVVRALAGIKIASKSYFDTSKFDQLDSKQLGLNAIAFLRLGKVVLGAEIHAENLDRIEASVFSSSTPFVCGRPLTQNLGIGVGYNSCLGPHLALTQRAFAGPAFIREGFLYQKGIFLPFCSLSLNIGTQTESPYTFGFKMFEKKNKLGLTLSFEQTNGILYGDPFKTTNIVQKPFQTSVTNGIFFKLEMTKKVFAIFILSERHKFRHQVEESFSSMGGIPVLTSARRDYIGLDTSILSVPLRGVGFALSSLSKTSRFMFLGASIDGIIGLRYNNYSAPYLTVGFYLGRISGFMPGFQGDKQIPLDGTTGVSAVFKVGVGVMTTISEKVALGFEVSNLLSFGGEEEIEVNTAGTDRSGNTRRKTFSFTTRLVNVAIAARTFFF